MLFLWVCPLYDLKKKLENYLINLRRFSTLNCSYVRICPCMVAFWLTCVQSALLPHAQCFWDSLRSHLFCKLVFVVNEMFLRNSNGRLSVSDKHCNRLPGSWRGQFLWTGEWSCLNVQWLCCGARCQPIRFREQRPLIKQRPWWRGVFSTKARATIKAFSTQQI